MRRIEINEQILCAGIERFTLDGYRTEMVETHEGGRNIVLRCIGDNDTVYLRFSCTNDRQREDYLSEAEFVHYLAMNGAPVADVLPSAGGQLVEEISTVQGTVYVSLFEEAAGDQLAAHGYQYRDGVPLSEYFFNCGRCLGRIHALSARYVPEKPRYDYSCRFNIGHFADVTPPQYAAYLPVVERTLDEIAALERTETNYGIVHFDFSDGNYMIDYTNGDINVFDFENCCRCWYLYDLANLWAHGVGWVQFVLEAEKRREFMDYYFAEVLGGYRSEHEISDDELGNLEIMIRLVMLENILDEFENGEIEEGEENEEILYRLKCLEEKIPSMGFFDEIYSAASPFCL